MFNNFDEAHIQLANAGAFLLFDALNEKYADGYEPNHDSINAALKDCTDAANWLCQFAHGAALNAALESLEAMSWFITLEQDRKAHEMWCMEQFKKWNDWAFENAQEEPAPLQSEETQKLAAKLNELLAM